MLVSLFLSLLLVICVSLREQSRPRSVLMSLPL